MSGYYMQYLESKLLRLTLPVVFFHMTFQVPVATAVPFWWG